MITDMFGKCVPLARWIAMRAATGMLVTTDTRERYGRTPAAGVEHARCDDGETSSDS